MSHIGPFPINPAASDITPMAFSGLTAFVTLWDFILDILTISPGSGLLFMSSARKYSA